MEIDEIFEDGFWIEEEEYQIQCPICRDHPTHNHCNLNPVKNLYHCYYCGAGGGLTNFIKKYGDAEPLTSRTGITQKKEYEKIDFEQFKTITKLEGVMGRSAKAYLLKRGITEKEIESHDFRYGTHGKFYGRVLMPICENGSLVCFSARAFFDYVQPKYLFPHTGETLLTTSEAIWRFDEALKQKPKNIVLTEGIFDAIFVNRIVGVFGMSVMSSELSKGQLYKLLKLPDFTLFIILLDSDASEKAIKMAREIHKYRQNVEVAFLERGDPAEVTEDELIEALDKRRAYSGELEGEILLK